MRRLVDAPGRHVTFGTSGADYHVAGGSLHGPGGEIAAIEAMRRSLPHDITNALAASALVLETGLVDRSAVAGALATFTGPPHRLEHVGTWNDVAWFNDSKATTPHAAAAAIRSFDHIVLIAGGYDKHVDLSPMAVDRGHVDAVIALGATAPAVVAAFDGVARRRGRRRHGRRRRARTVHRRPGIHGAVVAGVCQFRSVPQLRTSWRALPGARHGHHPRGARMSSTLTVADRRRAALDRLHGGEAPPRGPQRRPQRGTDVRRPKPATRRSAAPKVAATREILGPPPGTYYAIAGVVTVLVMLGLVMVLSASAVTEANLGHSPYRVFAKQAMWAAIGLVGLVVVARIDYRSWRRFVIPLGLLSAAAMAAPFAPGIGASVNGAHSWVRLGPLSVQPSEFLKLAVVVLAADLLTRRQRRSGRPSCHARPARAPGDARSRTVSRAGRPGIGRGARGDRVQRGMDRRSPRDAVGRDGGRCCECSAAVRRVEPSPPRPVHGVHERVGGEGPPRLSDLSGLPEHGVGRDLPVRGSAGARPSWATCPTPTVTSSSRSSPTNWVWSAPSRSSADS